MNRRTRIFLISLIIGLGLGMTIFHFAALMTYRDVISHPHSWRGIHLDRLSKWENIALHYGVEINE